MPSSNRASSAKPRMPPQTKRTSPISGRFAPSSKTAQRHARIFPGASLRSTSSAHSSGRRKTTSHNASRLMRNALAFSRSASSNRSATGTTSRINCLDATANTRTRVPWRNTISSRASRPAATWKRSRTNGGLLNSSLRPIENRCNAAEERIRDFEERLQHSQRDRDDIAEQLSRLYQRARGRTVRWRSIISARASRPAATLSSLRPIENRCSAQKSGFVTSKNASGNLSGTGMTSPSNSLERTSEHEEARALAKHHQRTSEQTRRTLKRSRTSGL